MINALNLFFRWLTKTVGKHISIVTIILVLAATMSYLGVKAEDIYNWYQGDITKLLVIMIVIMFLTGLICFSFIEHDLGTIKKMAGDAGRVLDNVDSLEKDIRKDSNSLNTKIDTIIRQIGDSSSAIVLLVQMSIQAVPQNIILAVEPYLELDELTNLQKQSLVEKLDEVKKSLFIEISYFIKRFYGEKLRTVVVNEPIKVAMRDAFIRCYESIDKTLSKKEYTASDKLAEINHISYLLVKALFKAILNEEYDIAKAKNMEGAARIARIENMEVIDKLNKKFNLKGADSDS